MEKEEEEERNGGSAPQPKRPISEINEDNQDTHILFSCLPAPRWCFNLLPILALQEKLKFPNGIQLIPLKFFVLPSNHLQQYAAAVVVPKPHNIILN